MPFQVKREPCYNAGQSSAEKGIFFCCVNAGRTNMDGNQTARMIEWLDEERRRDKQTITTLLERLAAQQEVMDTLNKRLNSLESDQSVIRAQFVPAGRDADMADQLRKEMQQMVEGLEAKRLTAERESERRAELNRESIMRNVRDLTDKATKLERQTTELPAIHVERDRLATIVQTLQQRVDDLYKKLDDPDRRIVFLEEQRRQDARRLSELESEAPELRKAFDGIRPKITLLEDLSIRNERKVVEVQNAERERREQMQQFTDQQTLLLQQRDQQVQELIKRFGEQDSVFQRNLERFETWSEAYRSMKKIVDDFERIGDRLERRINEVAEMQRLSEERFRSEWNEWRSDDQKRWKQFTLSNDEVWRLHDKEFERFVARLSEIESLFAPLQDAINRLWNLERERAQLYRDRYQAMLLEHDKGGNVPTTTSMPAVNLNNGGGGGGS
jgi:chromosome segregation ATPase